MGLSQSTIQQLAQKLYQAEINRVPLSPLTDEFPDMTSEEAYRVQLEIIQERVNKGAKIVGKKIGLTSKPMQQMMGVNEPDYGHILDDMIYSDMENVDVSTMIQPKIEAELAFVLGEDLKGPGITVADVLAATEYIVPAIEIIDSRVTDWKIKLGDTIADNGSSAKVVLGGTPTRVAGLELQLLGMVLEKNGQLIATGAAAAALGHPAYAVAWLANKLAQFDIALNKGEVILSGAVTAAVHVEKGDTITVMFSEVGSVSVTFI